MTKRWRKIIKIGVRTFAFLLLLLNTVAYLHAYKFTHFSTSTAIKTKKPEDLSFVNKLNALLFGINNPRPTNNNLPSTPYSTVNINSNAQIQAWQIPCTTKPLGTVILFHGYGSNKSALIPYSKIFDSLGYNTFLVDFMGSGGSQGNTTTIGFKEAQQVMDCFNYLASKAEKNIILWGNSMGAVAIMKAIKDYNLNPNKVILECPFGSMQQTVNARFKNMNLPSFPMANLLVFWGGVQNDFWAFITM
jgi:uncharacterized protein